MEIRKRLVQGSVGLLALGSGAAGIMLLGAGTAANAATITQAPASQPMGSGPDATHGALKTESPGGPQVQSGPGSTTTGGSDVNTGPDVNSGAVDTGGSAG